MNIRDKAVKALNENGFFHKRKGSNHDIYYNEKTKRIIPLKRHDFDEDDLRYILKEIKQYKN